MERNELFELIKSGSEGRERVARMFFKDIRLIHGVKKVLSSLGAAEREFEDVFNYTIVQFFKNVMKDPAFEIKTNVNSYLFGIARNIYIQKLRKQRIQTSEIPDHLDAVDEGIQVDLKIMDDERKEMLTSVLNQLGVKCREVLMYWASGYKMAEIAKLLDYASDVVVRRKKMNCMQELLTYLDANAHIKAELAR
jgi:RNA polymerase sigma-70 factor (ECF subfamily)